MAYAWCKNCDNQFFYPDGSSNTGFCSDQCFGRYSLKKAGTPLWKKVLPLLLAGSLGAAWFYRLDLALHAIDSLPEHAGKAARFMVRQGPEGLAIVLKLMLEDTGVRRTAAIAALEFVDEPATARDPVLARLGDLDKLCDKLGPDEQADLSAGLGRCGIKEWKSRWVDQLSDPARVVGAVRALGHLGDAEAVAPLMGLVSQAVEFNEPSAVLLVRVAQSLGMIKDTSYRALPVLLGFLAHKEPAVRAASATAIGRLCADFSELLASLSGALTGDRIASLRHKITRLEEAYGKLNSIGAQEPDPEARRAMAEAYVIMGRVSTPAWAR
jgi:HEAT repeat protein